MGHRDRSPELTRLIEIQSRLERLVRETLDRAESNADLSLLARARQYQETVSILSGHVQELIKERER